jgi:hypothetical protein
MAFKQKKCNAKLTDTTKLKYGNRYKSKSFSKFNPEDVSIPIVYNKGADSHISPVGDVDKTVGFFSNIVKKVVNGVESIYANSVSLMPEFLDRIKKEKAYLSIGAGGKDLEMKDNDIYEVKDIHHVALIFSNNIQPRNKGCFIESITDSNSNNDIIEYIEDYEFSLSDNEDTPTSKDESVVDDINNQPSDIQQAVYKVLNDLVKDENTTKPEIKIDNSMDLLNMLIENDIDIKKFKEYKDDEDFQDLDNSKIIKIIKKNYKNTNKSIDSEVSAISFEENDKNVKKSVDKGVKIDYSNPEDKEKMREKAKAMLEKYKK